MPTPEQIATAAKITQKILVELAPLMIGEVDDLLTVIKAQHLETPPYWNLLTHEAIAKCWNGIGPDAWPPEVRGPLSFILRTCKPAALIHDVEFQHSDGTRKTWLQVQARWTKNVHTLNTARWPLSNPLLWLPHAAMWTKSHLAILALQKFSFTIYCQAFKRFSK